MILQAATNDVEKLASANAAFGFSLMKQVVGERPNQNVFISPYSVSAALQMVWQGAVGQTKAEMDEALALTGLEAETTGSAYKELDKSIKSAGTKATISIANSVWYAPSVELKPQFASVNQNFYGAKLSALDFTDPRSAGVVNSWVNEATHGKIKKIVDPPLSSMTGAFLANAIYFKGTWEHQFNNNLTHDEPFQRQNGQQKQVPMMFDSRKFSYQQNDHMQAVRLGYVGGRVTMVVILPATNSSPADFLAELSADTWRNKFVPNFETCDGLLKMPRFKVEFRADLIPVLKAMGVRRAFEQNADFSGISDTQLFISGVKHASFVDVTEEGTEAAAATGVGVAATSLAPRIKPFHMIVDRPFLFVIEDSVTHAILFIGIVNEP